MLWWMETEISQSTSDLDLLGFWLNQDLKLSLDIPGPMACHFHSSTLLWQIRLHRITSIEIYLRIFRGTYESIHILQHGMWFNEDSHGRNTLARWIRTRSSTDTSGSSADSVSKIAWKSPETNGTWYHGLFSLIFLVLSMEGLRWSIIHSYYRSFPSFPYEAPARFSVIWKTPHL